MSTGTERPSQVLTLPSWEVEIDGQTYTAEIARCESFTLGIEDHGLFTAQVAFEGSGWGQGLSAHALDTFDKDRRERVGTAFGCDYIIALVRVLGSPERAKGRRVVLFRDQPYGLIKGFAALGSDDSIGEPFFPQALADRHFPPAEKGSQL